MLKISESEQKNFDSLKLQWGDRRTDEEIWEVVFAATRFITRRGEEPRKTSMIVVEKDMSEIVRPEIGLFNNEHE